MISQQSYLQWKMIPTVSGVVRRTLQSSASHRKTQDLYVLKKWNYRWSIRLCKSDILTTFSVKINTNSSSTMLIGDEDG